MYISDFLRLAFALAGAFLTIFLAFGTILGGIVLYPVLRGASPSHPWVSVIRSHISIHRPFLHRLAVAALFWVAFQGFMNFLGGLSVIAGGNIQEGLKLCLIGFLLYSAIAAPLFFWIKKGKTMPSIFDIATNRAALAEFTNVQNATHHRPLAEIDPAKLADLVRNDVIGQDEIVNDVSGQLARRIRLSLLQKKAKPLGVVMFVGATGAGKTELAKAIAKYGFENRLFRVDCNELTAEHSAQRLIGAPPGYMGSEQGGHLTRAIMQLGSGVLLFDEIEKAHETVYKLIMGLMDEGRLTEQSTGQVADASNFFIVLTSNAAHEQLAELAERVTDPDERRRAVKDTLSGIFKPEQLARIDDIYCFAPLPRAAMVEVVGKFLFGFAKDTGVELVGVDSQILIDTVMRHEKGSKYGIRELIRIIERNVTDGMLDRRSEGFKKVSIVCENDGVRVVGVPDAPQQKSGFFGGAVKNKVVE